MAYVAADGPPDLDATHAWDSAGAAANPPTLNNRASDPATLPWIRVDGIQGWRSLPESEDNREGRTFGQGEIPLASRKLGKTLVYECTVMAKTRETLRNLLSLSLAGFGSSLDEGVMTVVPYAAPGGVTWTYSARVIDLQADRAFSYSDKRRAHFQQGFTVSLRMSDPFFYTGGVAFL